MNRLFTAGTIAVALTAPVACTQNAARDPDQPIAAQRDSIGPRDTTSPAYQAMKRADSATVLRTDTTARPLPTTTSAPK